MLSEFKGYQSADIISTGGKDDFFSWGAEGNFAKWGEEALKNLGFVVEHFAFGGAKGQRAKLENEGIVFEDNGRINLKKYRMTL